MDIDPKGNLWVANSEVPNPISVLTAHGVWKSFPYYSAIGTSRIISLTVSPSGIIWLALARDNGLFALSPGNDVEASSDDIYLKFRPRDANGNLFSNEVTALAFDRDGYLWLGTNQGVLVSYNPHRVLQGETSFQKSRYRCGGRHLPWKPRRLRVLMLMATVNGLERLIRVYLFSADGQN